MVVPSFNSGTKKVKAGGSLWVLYQPDLHSKLQVSDGDSQDYLKKKKKQASPAWENLHDMCNLSTQESSQEYHGFKNSRSHIVQACLKNK